MEVKVASVRTVVETFMYGTVKRALGSTPQL